MQQEDKYTEIERENRYLLEKIATTMRKKSDWESDSKLPQHPQQLFSTQAALNHLGRESPFTETPTGQEVWLRCPKNEAVVEKAKVSHKEHCLLPFRHT